MNEAMESRLDIQQQGAITRIAIDPARVRYPVDCELLLALQSALRSLDRDEQCQTVVLKGAEAVFCNGEDLTRLEMIGHRPQLKLFLETLQLLEDMRPVVIAHGNANPKGDGLELIAACDLIIQANPAVSGPPRISWALAPSGNAKAKLARFVNHLPELESALLELLCDRSHASEPAVDRASAETTHPSARAAA